MGQPIADQLSFVYNVLFNKTFCIPFMPCLHYPLKSFKTLLNVSHADWKLISLIIYKINQFLIDILPLVIFFKGWFLNWHYRSVSKFMLPFTEWWQKSKIKTLSVSNASLIRLSLISAFVSILTKYMDILLLICTGLGFSISRDLIFASVRTI